MAKYIDTDKIKDNAVFPYLGGDEEKRRIYREGFYRAMQCVERAEVEDVAPVVHGKWSDTMVCQVDPIFGDSHFGFKCSECGAVLNKTAYCGNCGAKMDRKGDGNGEIR